MTYREQGYYEVINSLIMLIKQMTNHMPVSVRDIIRTEIEKTEKIVNDIHLGH